MSIIVAGGRDSISKALSSVEILDPDSTTWCQCYKTFFFVAEVSPEPARVVIFASPDLTRKH
jgi:Kelch motif